MTNIQLEGKQTSFKLGTGVEVTGICSDTHKKMGNPQLNTPDRILYGPSRQPLKVEGHFLAAISQKNRTARQQVFLVWRT